MRTTVCLPGELGRPELDLWRRIRSARPDLDSPFLSPEFTLAVGRARPNARVAVIEEGGRVVAFFPFERGRFGLGVAIGAGLCDSQAIICEQDAHFGVQEMLAQCGLAAWRFDHLVGTQHAWVAPRAVTYPSPVIDCSVDFATYLRQEGRRGPKLLQKERKLGREVGPVRFGFEVSDDHALAKVIEWKSEQYRRTGRPDRFASKSNVGLIRELAATDEPDLRGVLFTLYAGDHLVAGEFSLRSRKTIAGWFPSHDCDFNRYSPGSLRLLRTIEAAGLAGVERYDLGKGEEEYKQGLKTGDSTVCEGWVVRPVPLGYLRRALSLPQEKALGVVLGHPRLRLAARAALRKLGTARLAADRRVRSHTARV